jgi:hypothetical protein
MIFELLLTGFSLSLLIVTLIFLEQNVHGHEDLIPNFDKSMFQFVYIGHWIVAGLTGLSFVVAMVFGGYAFANGREVRVASESIRMKKAGTRNTTPRARKQRAAPYQFIEL